MKNRIIQMNGHKSRRTTQHVALLLFCVCRALSWSATVQAETNFYAQASTTETNVFLGQVIHLDVLVKADKPPEAPSPKTLTDFKATLIASGAPTGEDNVWLYRYGLRAKAAGKLQVPIMRFGTRSTNPITIHAEKPEQTDRMKLDMTLSKSSVYLNEPVVLTATWDSTYQFGAIKAVDFDFPILNDKRVKMLELYEPDPAGKANATGLPVHGTRVLAARKSYQKEGVQHQSLTFSKLLIPQKSGTLTLPSASLLCAAIREKDSTKPHQRRSAFQYPAYFDNTFFDQNVQGGNWTRIYAESPPITLEVKPLPTEGRPALFNGMVGQYTLNVAAEPLAVRVGEPITLTITITAAGHMESIIFEPLRAQPLLVNRFEIPSDRSLPQRRGQSKIYTQTIRPLSTANTEIPPLQLAYFDPMKETYVTVQSTAIPLKVSPAEEVGVFGGALYQNRLRVVEEGIRHNYEKADMLETRRKPLFGIHPLVVLGTLLLPPMLIGGLALAALFGKKRHQIHRTAKAARAYKVFRKNAVQMVRRHSMKREIYEDLDRVLRAYLGDRLHLRPGALAFRDAEKKLIEAGAAERDIAQLKALFAVCEAYRFTSGYDEKTHAKRIVQHAVRTVKTLERSLK